MTDENAKAVYPDNRWLRECDDHELFQIARIRALQAVMAVATTTERDRSPLGRTLREHLYACVAAIDEEEARARKRSESSDTPVGVPASGPAAPYS